MGDAGNVAQLIFRVTLGLVLVQLVLAVVGFIA